MREYMLQPKDKSEEVVECLIPTYVIGKCMNDKMVKEEHFENNTLNLNYNDIISFLVKSKPTLKTNLAFREQVVKDHYIFNASVKHSDVESLFLKPRHFSTNTTNHIESADNFNTFGTDKKQFEPDVSKKTFVNDSPMDYITSQFIKKYVFSNNSSSYVLI